MTSGLTPAQRQRLVIVLAGLNETLRDLEDALEQPPHQEPMLLEATSLP